LDLRELVVATGNKTGKRSGNGESLVKAQFPLSVLTFSLVVNAAQFSSSGEDTSQKFFGKGEMTGVQVVLI